MAGSTTLQAIVELVDKMSGPLGNINQKLDAFNSKAKAGGGATKGIGDGAVGATGKLGALTAGLGAAGVALAALGAATAVFQAFAAASRAADMMDDLAEKTGIAASALRDYQLVATLSGTSLDSMISGLNRLNRSIALSEDETKKQALAFEALGISTEDASGNLKGAEETFLEIADAFEGLKDGPEKAAIAVALFGGKANELIPLLNKGAEGIQAMQEEAAILGQMGPAAFDAFAEQSGTMYDNIDKLQTLFGGLVSVIAAEVVPIVNIMIEAFINSYKSGGMVYQIFEGIKTFAIGFFIPAMKEVIIVMRALADVVDIAGKSLGALGAIIGAVASGDVEGARTIWELYKQDISDVADEHVAFAEDVRGASNSSLDLTSNLVNFGKVVPPSINRVRDAAKGAKSELEAMLASLTMDNATFGMDEAARKLLEAEAKYKKDIAAGIAPARAAELLAQTNAQIMLNQALRDGAKEQEAFNKATKSIDEYQRQTELLEFEATLVGKSADERARLVEKFREEQAMRASLIGLTDEHAAAVMRDTAAAQERRDAAVQAAAAANIENDIMSQSLKMVEADVETRIAAAARLFEQGKISSDDYTRYVEAQTKRLTDLTKKEIDGMTEFWMEAARGMQNTMSSFFFDVMQGDFDNLGDRFKVMLDRMIADALAANLANAMFGKGFTQTGEMGGWIGSLFGMFGGARANGGPVQAGKAYLVGERGPEPFIPNVSGTILPNSSLSAAGGGGQVNVNITAMDSQDVRRALEKNNRWIAGLVHQSNRAYNLGA